LPAMERFPFRQASAASFLSAGAAAVVGPVVQPATL
jgi:hypothetical protein